MSWLSSYIRDKLNKGISFNWRIPRPEGSNREDNNNMSIKTFFQGLFNKFVKAFREFIAEALPIAKTIIIAMLKDIAIQAVTKASLTNLKDEDKRKQAFKEIKDYAVMEGIEAGDSIISTTLELALQKIKG